jgi:large subunit ribosomal protein L18
MSRLKSRKDNRAIRHRRVRRKVFGTAERPRMAVMVSNRHMYVQFIDDTRGVTLASASSLDAGGAHNVAGASGLGERAAEAAARAGIRRVVVDRGGFKFHGKVKAIVDGASGAGLATRGGAEMPAGADGAAPPAEQPGDDAESEGDEEQGDGV